MKINELKAYVGEEAELTVFLTDVKETITKYNNRWLELFVSDNTGSAMFKVWSEVTLDINPEELIGCPVTVTGQVDLIQGQGGLNVLAIRKAEKETYKMSDFFPALSEQDEKYLLSRLEILVEQVSDVVLKNLLKTIFSESRQRKMAEKCGGTNHHAFFGGLLAHLVQVAELAKAAADMYSVVGPYRVTVDTDLVIAGALLHDIGKLTTLSDTPGQLTERGFNLNSSTESVLYVTSYNNQLEEKVKDLAPLDNIILACGDVKPRNLEAIIVRNANFMSNQVDAYGLAFSGASSKKRGGTLSYSREVGAYLLRGKGGYE